MLGNIYDIVRLLYLELYFLVLFGNCGIFFLPKDFSFYPKNSISGCRKATITQEQLLVESGLLLVE